MIYLSREVRFHLVPAADADPDSRNSWAGVPSSERLLPYLVLRCTIAGELDQRTGYLCNVKVIDGLLRDYAITSLVAIPPSQPDAAREQALLGTTACRLAWDSIVERLPPEMWLEQLELEVSPYQRYTRRMTAPMIYLTQQFEFSASHRLHCNHLSDAENWELFGKCNRENGHGHNYRVDVTVVGEVDQQSGVVVTLAELERVVQEVVIDRFDHRHLNLDTDEFADLNPTVENIARVIWDLLTPHLPDGKLCSVRVFETPKTWAEFRGPSAVASDSI